MNRFDVDTAIERTGEGRYAAGVPEHWSVGPGPNGGFLAAVAARALQDALQPPLRSLTLHYLAPPVVAALDVEVTPLRVGRTTAFARCELFQEGELKVTCLAALAPWREDAPGYADVPAPAWPALEDLIEVESGRPGQPAFLGNYEMRVRRPDPGARPIVLGGLMRSAEPRPLDAPLVAAITDAWIPPAVVRLPEPVFCPTIDLTIHFRAPLPLDGHPWVHAVVTSTTATGGTTEEDVRLHAEDGTLLAQARQLAVVRRVPR